MRRWGRAMNSNGLPLMLLTAEEAARVLRLADDRDEAAAVKALNRLVDRGFIRPALVGKRRRYSIGEIQRFIDARIEHYGDTPA
jgi:hypothetical protein